MAKPETIQLLSPSTGEVVYPETSVENIVDLHLDTFATVNDLSAAMANAAKTEDLASVALSGSFNDLSDLPETYLYAVNVADESDAYALRNILVVENGETVIHAIKLGAGLKFDENNRICLDPESLDEDQVQALKNKLGL